MTAIEWSDGMKNGTALIDPPDVKPHLDLSALEPGVPLRIANVGWDDYEDFLEIIGDRRYRTCYADGEYEILMPSPLHAIWVKILCRLIEALTEELDLEIKSVGMCTVRRHEMDKGLEPDDCYYLENEYRVRGKLLLDFNVDPPPDLAIEVEVTSSVEKRMSIYVALRVLEVWRYKEDSLIVNRLAENGEYEVAERSRFFPQVPINELVRFVKQYDQMGERKLMQSFREWVRQQIAAGWQNS
jgi:Uma2 family endonuclease